MGRILSSSWWTLGSGPGSGFGLRRGGPWLIAVLAAAATFAGVWWWRTGPTRLALAVVEAARSPAGIPEELVDAELVERVRRVELVRRLSLDTAERGRLLDALSGEVGPDRRYPPAERPLRQRERASRGVRGRLQGECRAERWSEGAAAWIARITGGSWGGGKGPAGTGQGSLPEEVIAEQRALRQRLAGAVGVRVWCTHGDLGMLVVRDGLIRRRVVEIFPTRAVTMEISPFDPSQK